MRKARTAAAFAICVLACVAPACAHAAVKIEKTVVVQSAPHGGVTPAGNLDVGQSVQETHVRLPARASDCDWSLTDPATGRTPATDAFPGQTWKLVFAGLAAKRDWALIVRVVNTNTHATREAPLRWRLALRCTTTPNPPTCFLQSLRVPEPHDYLSMAFHCSVASSGFRITLPAGYGVRLLLAADNSLLHEAMECKAAGRTLSCRGRTPANTTTWVGFFLTKPVKRGLPVTVSVPRARTVRARTRNVNVRF